jgi:hypothetical protein
MATREHDEDRPASPWSSTSVQLSTLFVLMLLVVGIAIAIFHHGSQHARAGNAPATSQARARPATTTISTACTLPAGNQNIPQLAPPAGTSWGQVGAMSVPQASTTLGPEHISGLWNTCFAHSPSGALLAALNFYAEGTAAPSGQVYRRLAVNAPAAALRTASNLDAEAGGAVQIAGYKYDSYAPSEAQVTVAVQGPKGAYEAIATTMTWVGTDWRYQFPPNGTPSVEILGSAQLAAPYVAWSAFS